MYLVLAAYNAGEGRVRRWMPERPGLSQEEFIDDIPFYETQNYVRKILATAEDYRRHRAGFPGSFFDIPATEPRDEIRDFATLQRGRSPAESYRFHPE